MSKVRLFLRLCVLGALTFLVNVVLYEWLIILIGILGFLPRFLIFLLVVFLGLPQVFAYFGPWGLLAFYVVWYLLITREKISPWDRVLQGYKDEEEVAK